MGGTAGGGGRSNTRGWLAALAAALLAPGPPQDPYRTTSPSEGPCRIPSSPTSLGPYQPGTPDGGPCRLQTPTQPPPPPLGPYTTSTPTSGPCRAISTPPASPPRDPYTPHTPATGPCEKHGGAVPHLPPPPVPADPPSTIVVQDDRTITVNAGGGPTGFPIHLIEIPTGRRITIQIRPDDPGWRRDTATGLWTLLVPIESDGGPYRFEETSRGASYIQARGRIDKRAPLAGVYTLDFTVGVAPADLSLSIAGPGISFALPKRRVAAGDHSIQVPVNPTASGQVVATAVFTPVEAPP